MNAAKLGGAIIKDEWPCNVVHDCASPADSSICQGEGQKVSGSPFIECQLMRPSVLGKVLGKADFN